MDQEEEKTVIVTETVPAHDGEPEIAVTETVAAAEAAAALAHQTAASAELQAAERVADVEREADEWKVATSQAVSDLTERLASQNEKLDALAQLEQERHSQHNGLHERLETIELLLAREAEKAEETESNPGSSSSESEPEETTIAGAEATAELAGVEASSGASLSAPATEKSESPSRPRKKRYWI